MSTAAPQPAPDDLALTRRIAAGDRASFELLMRQHNPRLFRVARAILKDDAEAEDALQDAYLSAFRAMHSFAGGSALGTWLTRIVINAALARLQELTDATTIPVFALGGIQHWTQVFPCLTRGAHGVAILGAAMQHVDSDETATLLRKAPDLAKQLEEARA